MPISAKDKARAEEMLVYLDLAKVTRSRVKDPKLFMTMFDGTLEHFSGSDLERLWVNYVVRPGQLSFSRNLQGTNQCAANAEILRATVTDLIDERATRRNLRDRREVRYAYVSYPGRVLLHALIAERFPDILERRPVSLEVGPGVHPAWVRYENALLDMVRGFVGERLEEAPIVGVRADLCHDGSFFIRVYRPNEVTFEGAHRNDKVRVDHCAYGIQVFIPPDYPVPADVHNAAVALRKAATK